MEKITVRVKMTEQEFRGWHLSRVFSPTFKIINAVIIVLMAGTFVATLASGRSAAHFVKSFLPVIIFYGAYLIIMPSLVYFNVKKIFETDDHIKQEQTYIFDEEGFTISAEYGNTWIGWDKIILAVVNKKYFSFCISAVKEYLVPKKDFAAPAEAEAVIRLIREKIDKKRVKIR
jgi:hypothetical protein